MGHRGLVAVAFSLAGIGAALVAASAPARAAKPPLGTWDGVTKINTSFPSNYEAYVWNTQTGAMKWFVGDEASTIYAPPPGGARGAKGTYKIAGDYLINTATGQTWYQGDSNWVPVAPQ